MVRPLRVLLDANVLVNAQVRNLFLTAAEFELIQVYWSDEILTETRRVLLDRLDRTRQEADRFLDAIRTFFPTASIDGYSNRIDAYELPDIDDRHVLAAAVQGRCDIIATFNTQDFPDQACEPLGVTALAPDGVVTLLDESHGVRLASVIEAMSRRLTRPHHTPAELVHSLERDLPSGARLIGQRLGLPGYAGSRTAPIEEPGA